ncbi:MAG: bifunctional glutamate N-acetyltransferase/amino-acid acetyltransferase ArgJ [Armatimonadetes bacterium]|nr:bifunctional glutamate N-acetyltransferase/amino-acid acetyltransferase ArgJ [Armatimonadota bacterium]
MAALTQVSGSVCAPRGYRAAGVTAGIKSSGLPDVALVVSDLPASAAGVFTTNRIVAAPVQVSREHLQDGRARAIVCNSGNANCLTGAQGLADARRMAALTAEALGIEPDEVLVASTGVIGNPLPMERVEAGIRVAARELIAEGSAAARAIMTTDTRPKEYAVEFLDGGCAARVGGIAKGVGMIGPHLATMLAFLTTDVQVWPEVLQSTLRTVAEQSFNCVTVDGDTSTNDSVFLLANGASGLTVRPGSPAHRAFEAALTQVCVHLAKELARDGEGATKLIEVRVTGARSPAQARQAARTIANSPLVKTAFFGNDPNWGRIVAAAGRSAAALDPARLSLEIAGIPTVRDGEPVPFDRDAARAALNHPEVSLTLDLGVGRASATVWTCDLTYEYVKINAEYTT